MDDFDQAQLRVGAGDQRRRTNGFRHRLQAPQPQAQVTKPKPPEAAATVPAIPSEMLLNSIPVRLVGTSAAPKATLDVLIRDIYRRQEQVFVRYSIENHSSQTFRTGRPTAVSLNVVRFDRSLWTFQNSQLGTDVASRLKADDAPIPVKIVCFRQACVSRRILCQRIVRQQKLVRP